MLLLEHNITRRRRVDKAQPEPKKNLEFETQDNNKYEAKAIINSVVYSQWANNSDQMPSFYKLVLWKGYSKEENTWEPLLAVIHLQKLINTFHKEHLEKPTATSLLLDSILPMVRPIVPKKLKQKRDCPSKKANKRGKN